MSAQEIKLTREILNSMTDDKLNNLLIDGAIPIHEGITRRGIIDSILTKMGRKMFHLEEAQEKNQSKFIHLLGNKISFTVQDGPIGDVGVNGLQATDILVYVKDLFVSLNNKYRCRENSLTITKLEEAIHWQQARTEDRESRGVEGSNKL